ncbi:hypothetical protein LCGC14_1318500 [marine sediment metagenome]|uniref:Uncharacterized protein n=1 Tax=marine sediment metagenome TaxID=412755 RepID=A0A0F9L5K1_9ZZZZ
MPDVINSPLNLNKAKSQRLETVYIDANGNWFRGIEDIGFLTGAVTDATALKISDPNQSFIHARFESTSTSGDERAMYLKLILSGGGQFGDVIRAYLDVTSDATTVANADAIHATVNTAAAGSVTGQAQAGRFTLEAPVGAGVLTGTLSSILLETFIGAGVTVPTTAAFIHCSDISGAYMSQFFNAVGCTAGATNAFETDAGVVGGTIKGYIRGLWTDGSQVYLVAYTSHS